jgi:predicted metal-dependent phosphoesterase TrpH
MHCHTTCSDGSLTPTQIVEHAVSKGLNALSITDHDTIAAYKTAVPIAKQLGLNLVSGVEFSTLFDNVSVHILGFAFSLKERLIQEFCLKHQEKRHSRNREILSLLAKKGMVISEEELITLASAGKNSDMDLVVGRPHIARLMVEKGYAKDIREAFDKYIGEDCPCYAAGEFFSPEETIDVIHRSKGLAFIAHPHLVNNSSILVKLLRMNFDGIECYYSKLPPSSHTRWLKIAKEKKWLISGGSDFHGAIKPSVPLGCSWVNEEHFEIISSRYRENEASFSSTT